MKTKIILSVMVFSSLTYSSFVGYAQTNLVPNGDFEQYSSCPDAINSNSPDQVAKADNWESSKGTPEYFNSCANISSNVSVPDNFFGSQNPFSGNAYCGFWAYFENSSYRETITAELINPLVIGQKYYVSFKASFAGNPTYSCCAINKIGALFSTIPYSISSNPPINNYSQIYSESIISDTLNWTMVSGSFFADSAYNYISIGNFYDNANTDTTTHYDNTSIAYYYIDDVKASTDSLFTTNIAQEVELNVAIYPNPFNQYLNIALNNNEKINNVEIYNLYGDILLNSKGTNLSSIIIDTNSFPEGLYTIIVRFNNSKKYITKKLLKHN